MTPLSSASLDISSIEDGAQPPADLSDFEPPVMVVVIALEAEVEAREAA